MGMEEAAEGKEWILEIWWGGVASAVDSHFLYRRFFFPILEFVDISVLVCLVL